jgi:hypothetical protein
VTSTATSIEQFSADFRIGHIFSLAWSVLSQNFLKFAVIAGVASLPLIAVSQVVNPANALASVPLIGAALAVWIVLFLLCQAILLHASFQYMIGRSVNLIESSKVALGRFFPIIGIGFIAIAALVVYVAGLGALSVALNQLLQSPGVVVLVVLIGMVPAVILFLMWFVAVPACVVERLGPFYSLGRSRALTKGHRWKIFGLQLVLLIAALVIGILVGIVMALVQLGVAAAGAILAKTLSAILNLMWNASLFAFHMTILAVTYYDLRAAKEGIGTDQIATVFE